MPASGLPVPGAFRVLGLVGLMLLALAVAGEAQTLVGQISGTVTDSSEDFSAEYGRNSGAAINVVARSGATNTAAASSSTSATTRSTQRTTSRRASPEIYLDNPTPQRWFNTSVFAPAPVDRRGNRKAGQIRGPWIQVWDISIRKQFPMRGQVEAQRQVDGFNAFNNVNFTGLSTNDNAADFGAVNATRRRTTFRSGCG